mmetsp:Transcript_10310/g.22426  ORF Transcript_10310/g.22426 Transcript_10310/m.22426 type:complete len:286 (+) Transcript_10310:540-1397(+)
MRSIIPMTLIAERRAAREETQTHDSRTSKRSRRVVPLTPSLLSACSTFSRSCDLSSSHAAMSADWKEPLPARALAIPALHSSLNPAATAGVSIARRVISPRYRPEIIFSKVCRPGVCVAASRRVSTSFMCLLMSKLPHSVLMTISSLDAPFHLVTDEPFSMYAPFVPVPKITPSVAVCSLYAAASIVPTVSLASAFTARRIPRSSNSFCSSDTTSLPSTSDAQNPLFQKRRLPLLSAVCSTGKEKVNPIWPDGLPPHCVARKCATESARKPKSASPVPVLMCSGT